MNSEGTSRRGFLKYACTAVAAPAMFAGVWSGADVAEASERMRVAYVAENWRMGMSAGIGMYEVRGAQWQRLGFHTAMQPSALALNSTGDRLYVANCVETLDHMPCGSVETYSVGRNFEAMRLLRRTPLSLACVHPDGLALSPDGSLLVVSASGCGILNLLPVDAQACAGPVTCVRKELHMSTGSGVEAAMPPKISFTDAKTFAIEESAGGLRKLYSCSRDAIVLEARERMEVSRAEAPIEERNGTPPLAVVWV